MVPGDIGGESVKGDGEVGGDRKEPNRFLGFPVSGHPSGRPAATPQRLPQAADPQDRPQAGHPERRPQGEEPQRVLGFPVEWLEPFVDEVLRPLLRRIRGTSGRG
jgi:hypothetical protein